MKPIPTTSQRLAALALTSLFLLRLHPAVGRAADADAASSAERSVAQLTRAGKLLQHGDLLGARQEYSKVAALPDVPAHHVWEARQRLHEVERLQAGLPARDPSESRTKVPPAPKAALALHVSPEGDEHNDGSAAKPFASLEQARTAIRAFRQSQPTSSGAIAVFVHGGEYLVHQTFKLGPEDSGTASAPIIYQAAPGEKPRFRGGVRLHGFTPVRDVAALKRLPAESAAKVFELDLQTAGITNLLPLKLGGFASGNGFRTHPLNEVFFNGQALQIARGPNSGFLKIKDVAVKDGTKGYDRQGSKTGKFFYADERPARWVTEPDLLLYGYWFWDWADSYERVASIDPNQRLITLAPPWHHYGFSVGAPFYAINALSELDTPGEYYLDRQHHKLFFYPPSDPAQATVELSLFAERMLELDNVSEVRFVGLTWELGSADAIRVHGGTNCLFAGCTVRQFAGNGLEIQGGQRHGVLSCDLYSMGRGGTLIHGGDRKTLQPGGHFIENCDIRDLSRIDHTYTPAVILDGVGNRIAHNRFHDILSSAMRVGGNDHVIEFNEIFNAVLESDDQGGADMFGNPTFRGNIYRFNYWHHIGAGRGSGPPPKCGQAGIRLDDAICGTLIYGNIFERCSVGGRGFGAVQIHGGKDNIVENNLFIDCAAAVSFTPWATPRWQETAAAALKDSAIDTTLYTQRYPELAHLAENPNTNHIYRNLLLRCGETLRHAKSVGAFDNVVLTNGEFALRANLPLLERPDFAPLPLSEIGLYSDSFRKAVR